MEITFPEGGPPINLPMPSDVVRDPVIQTWQSLVNGLLDSHSEQHVSRLAVEFECGECCKKVLNGARIFFIPVINVAVLLPPSGQSLLLKVFSCGHIVDKEKLRAIIIPISRICSIEFGAVQIDP